MDAFIVSKPENIRYLSGFTGGSDAILLISRESNYLVTDSRYIEQAARESPEWEFCLEKPPDTGMIAKLAGSYRKVGFEPHAVTYQEYMMLSKSLPCELYPLTQVVEEMRKVKEEEELQCLRKAAAAGAQVFDQICDLIQPGLSEKHIAAQIGFYLREYGCEKESFDTISLSGQNAAMPHGMPGNDKLTPGDMLTLDFGGFYQGYAGDMTRTVAVSKADQCLVDRYQAVLEAQKKGVNMVKAGVSCRDIDLAVRESLKEHQLDQYFTHGLGHGVGLEIHESPRVSFRSEEILEKNMVITIEPGIYIPGWGGIRIEDTVIVKERGCEIITASDKQLLII